MDCSPPGSSVHRILQASILAISISRASSQPRDRTQISHIAGRFFTTWATREAQEYWSGEPIAFPGELPNPGIEKGSPALQADSLSAELHWWTAEEERRLSGQRELTAWGKVHRQQQHPRWLSCGKFHEAGTWQGVQVGSTGRGLVQPFSLVYWAFRFSWSVPVPKTCLYECMLGMSPEPVTVASREGTQWWRGQLEHVLLSFSTVWICLPV